MARKRRGASSRCVRVARPLQRSACTCVFVFRPVGGTAAASHDSAGFLCVQSHDHVNIDTICLTSPLSLSNLGRKQLKKHWVFAHGEKFIHKSWERRGSWHGYYYLLINQSLVCMSVSVVEFSSWLLPCQITKFLKSLRALDLNARGRSAALARLALLSVFCVSVSSRTA
jgi:hypothetical protein